MARYTLSTLTLIQRLLVAGIWTAAICLSSIAAADDLVRNLGAVSVGSATVIVVDAGGHESRGRIVSVTDEAIELAMSGRSRVFPAADVRAVYRRHRWAKRGSLIGVVGGVVSGVIAARDAGGDAVNHAAVPAGLFGAGIGAMVGAIFVGRTLVFRHPTVVTAVNSVAVTVAAGRHATALQLRFGF